MLFETVLQIQVDILWYSTEENKIGQWTEIMKRLKV